MSLQALRACVSAALNGGKISREDADEILRRYEAMEAADRTGVNGSVNVKAMLAEQLRAEGVETKRRELLQAKAQGQIASDVRREALRMNRANLATGLYSIFENFGQSGSQSVRATYLRLLGAAHTEWGQALRDMRRNRITLRRGGSVAETDLARAAFGEEAPEAARVAYQSWLAPVEKLRTLFNEAGGAIKWRGDWGLPMRHSANALIQANFDRWRGFIAPLLDWEKMAHGVSEAPILPGERDGVLRGVYDSIVMDGWNKREPASGGGGAALWAQRADPRFLKFRDSASWLSYNREFGTGSVVATMGGHMRGMASDVALMQRLGPSPAATVHWMKELAQSEAGKQAAGEPSLLAAGSRQSAKARAWTIGHTLDGFYDVARGASAPSSPVGDVMATLRNVELSAKLGGAVILHTFSNPVIAGMARFLQGHAVLSVPLDLIRQMSRTELDQAGMIVGDMAHTLERGAREQAMTRKTRELSNWLPQITANYTGLDFMVEANRRAAFFGQMTGWANQLGKEWGQLPSRLRDTLDGHGIRADDWAVIRKATPAEPAHGAPLLNYQDIGAVDHPGAEQAALKYLGMLHMAAEAQVPTSNWRVKAAITGQLAREGTVAGELTRSAMMFKSGFMATFMLTQFRALARAAKIESGGTLAAYGAVSATALTLAGLLTLQAKQARNGKDFLPMDARSPEGRATWEHAFLTSGALGIYGDFIASDRSSYGHDFIATMAGPMATAAEDTWHGMVGLKDWATGAQTKTGKDVGRSPGEEAVNVLRNNTPMLSTHWALTAAYNRIFLDKLQEMADPQAHERWGRLEQRVARDTHQGFWWRPGAPKPDRLPAFTGSP